MIRQNNSLRKTLPLIRDSVIGSQGNKIVYLQEMIREEREGRLLGGGRDEGMKENAKSRERSYIKRIT